MGVWTRNDASKARHRYARRKKIKIGLQYLLKEAKENKLQFSVEAEDIHLNIEKC